MADAIDVAVVGGGPAGLFAAVQLARAGHCVDLFEEHGAFGQPVHCTGVLAREAFDEFDLPRSSVLNELTTVCFHAPSGDTVEYSTPSVEAVVIDRVAFDQQLARLAADAGVRVRRARVTGVAVDATGATIVTAAEAFRARVCVLACGAGYALQQRLGLGVPRVMLHSAQSEIAAGRLGEVEVHFGREIAPGGFGWAVPVRRGAARFVRVGVMTTGDSAACYRRMLDRISARWEIGGSTPAQPRQKILPLAPIGRTYADRVVALGDAAGLVKPTTGGGIYYSLLSARLAAETLDGALRDDDLGRHRLAAYEAGWRKRLGSELRWQLIMRRVANRLSDEDINRLFRLARTDGIMPLVRETAAFNRHREFIVALLKHPPARSVLFRSAPA
jgi:geranylgeranyl reductase family protein